MNGQRFFRYNGPPVLTRGEYGVAVVGGHTTEDNPELISVFDPDFGDQGWISVVAGQAGDWEEITEEEHALL